MKNSGVKSSFQGNHKTLERGLKTFEELCRRKEGMKQSDVAVFLNVDRSTAMRFMNTLLNEEYVYRAENGSYHPTMKILQLAGMVLAGTGMHQSARNKLVQLARNTGFSTHLAVLSGNRVVYVDGEEGLGMVKFNTGVGFSAPVHCTATGKALTAFLDPPHRKILVTAQVAGGSLESYTKNTITDPVLLEKEYETIRKRGYAMDDEEYERGILCFAAPIFDYTGKVVAVIGLSGIVPGIEEAGMDKLAGMIMEAAKEISANLGFQESSNNPNQASPGSLQRWHHYTL